MHYRPLTTLAKPCRNQSAHCSLAVKPCLPSVPLYGGYVEGNTTLQAILNVPLTNPQEAAESVKLLWPTHDGAPDESVRITRPGYMLTDQRNWISGLHGGGRRVSEGTVARSQLTENEAP